MFIYLSTVKHKAPKEAPEPAVVTYLFSTPFSGHPISTVDDETQLHSPLGPHQSTVLPLTLTYDKLSETLKMRGHVTGKNKLQPVQYFHSVYKNRSSNIWSFFINSVKHTAKT